MRVLVIMAASLLVVWSAACTAGEQAVRSTQSRDEISIDNGLVSVRYNIKDTTFSAKQGGKLFLKRGRFPEASDGARAELGTGENSLGVYKAIEVKFPSGRVYLLALYRNLPFLVYGVSVHSTAGQMIGAGALTPGLFDIDVGKAPSELRVLGCDGLTGGEAKRTSYTFLAVAYPQTRDGVVCGWLTQKRASGIVLSSVENGQISIQARAEYGKLRLAPGQIAEGELGVIGWFEDAAEGLEAYGDAIAKIHEIKLPEIPSGYCTWYSRPYGGASDEKHVAELAEFCGEHLRKFGFDTLQIDDKWQISGRDFTTHRPSGPFPSGMKATTQNINKAGLTAGIWFIPFGWDHKRAIFEKVQDWFVHKEDGSIYSVKWAGDCLDMTHPEARAFLDKVIRRITREWGYKYIKIDGMWTGMAVRILYPQPTYRADGLGDAVFHNPAKTNVEAYRDGLKLVRKAAGDDVYILGCNIAQNMRTLGGSIGLVDGMRIGSDTGARWSGVLRGAMMGTRLYFFHNRVWHNDPDCLMLRDPLTVDQARAWGSWIGISGQLNMVSEWLPGLPADKLEVIKRSMPNHGLWCRPVDLFENDPARIWHLTAGAGQQRRDVVGLFNWRDKEGVSVTVDPRVLGLDDGGTGGYVGFDYWADKFVGPFSGELKSELRPSSCRIISIRPVVDRPVLVGTSRHVTQGIIDVVEEKWNPKTPALTGRSRVVAGDPYELRVFAGRDDWKIESVVLGKSDSKAGVKTQSKQRGREIRVMIKSSENREVEWAIRFKKG